MRRQWFAVLASAVALIASGSAQGPSSDTIKAFNGTSLSGWRTEGSAQWRVAGGELVGSAASGPGSLVLDKSHQDVILRFAFRCDGCDAGVMLRNAAQPSKPGTSTALYVGLSGADARTLHRVTLDAQNKEVERTNLYKWTARQNPPGMQMRMTPGANGWTAVHVQVRGNVTAPPASGRSSQQASLGTAAADSPETYPMYGPLSLRVSGGEVRIKDVTVTDLLHPAAGIAAEVTSPSFRRVQLTDRFYSEGISAGDINRDGVMDALTGPYAYLGPDFKRSIEIYRPQVYAPANPTMAGLYTDNFLNYVHDFNSDGWPDYLKVNFNGAYLYVNPKGESRYWPMSQVTEGVSSETTQLGDIDGDGKVELLMSVGSGANRGSGSRSRAPIRPSAGRSTRSRTRVTGVDTATVLATSTATARQTSSKAAAGGNSRPPARPAVRGSSTRYRSAAAPIRSFAAPTCSPTTSTATSSPTSSPACSRTDQGSCGSSSSAAVRGRSRGRCT